MARNAAQRRGPGWSKLLGLGLVMVVGLGAAAVIVPPMLLEPASDVALIKGDITGDAPVLVRMHALDPLRDMVGLGPQGRAFEFSNSMKMIAEHGRGVVVLLRDVHMKMAAEGEVSPQTLRQYGVGAQILSSLGVGRMELLTNSGAPRVVGLDAYGLEIIGTRKITGDM